MSGGHDTSNTPKKLWNALNFFYSCVIEKAHICNEPVWKTRKKNHFSYQLHQKDKKCTESLKLLPFTRQNLLPRYNWKQNQVAVHAALFETYLAQWRHATSHLFNDNFLCELVIISTYH